LKQARTICLEKPDVYAQVVPGILRVIGSQGPLELRQWGSDFLAETFASPVISADKKQDLSTQVLGTILGYLDRQPEEDTSIVKSAVQCAASIYPLIFRHIINNPANISTWTKMTNIKQSILKRMDTAPAGVRICCIKFVSRVVQVQTPGVIADPRRPEQNEISLALVPRDHAVIPPNNLEAEASGLLDRLLGVLQDNETDALVVTATLNSLSSLVHRRASIMIKIMTTVLIFDPLMLSRQHALKGKDKLAIRSMTKTTMLFLMNVLKRNPQQQLAERLHRRVEQLKHSLVDALAGGGAGKRKAAEQGPDEPTNGFDDAKRRRVDQQVSHQPLPAGRGPFPVAQVFNLNAEPGAAGFDVTMLPANIMQQLMTPLLQSIEPQKFDAALNAVRSRLLDIEARQRAPLNINMQAGDEDDEYDPASAFLARAAASGADGAAAASEAAPKNLLKLEHLTTEQSADIMKTLVGRYMEELNRLDQKERQERGAAAKFAPAEFNLYTGYNRNWYRNLLIRIATKGSAPWFHYEQACERVKHGLDATNHNEPYQLHFALRDALLDFIMADWKHRLLEDGMQWFTDEFLHEPKPQSALDTPIYTKYTLACLDQLILYADMKDVKTLIRFFADAPKIWPEHVRQIRRVAEDPDRVRMAQQVLLFLVQKKAVVSPLALDVAEEIWREVPEAK
ncbi:hypothetical protein EJ03DRAFT_243928, partial [Teratosphaeria nubilosa]